MNALSLWSHRLVCVLTHRHFQNTVYVCTIFSVLLVLGMTGMELMYLIAVHMMLCLGFVVKTILIANQVFGYCWIVLTQDHDLLCPPPPAFASPKQVGWVWASSWKGMQPGQVTQRDTPHYKTCSATNTGVKAEGSRVVSLLRWLLLVDWLGVIKYKREGLFFFLLNQLYNLWWK